jgi:hypothetical protein
MKTLLSLVIVTAVTAGPAFSQCVAPLNDVKIPNGNKATMEEMVAANHAIQENTTEVETYWQCLKAEQADKIAAIGPDITDDQKTKISSEYVNRHNAEADKLQTLADRYDVAERSFRAKLAAEESTEEANLQATAINEAQQDEIAKAHQEGIAPPSHSPGEASAATRGEPVNEAVHSAAEKARRDAAAQDASEASTPVVPKSH